LISSKKIDNLRRKIMPTQKPRSKSLTGASFIRGISYLSRTDPDLARVVSELGKPPLWAREPGFPTLVLIILEQQVSLASARAAFKRLQDAANPLSPKRFLEFDDRELKTIGFSRQKSLYCRDLAGAIIRGNLHLAKLHELEDSTVRSRLMEMKGIGTWTADIYLMMAMLRPDVWPSGDLALATATQELKRLHSRPAPEKLDEIARPWRPWRAVAARILWHHYLSKKR
jgi:DNA-3-methyladenine glycosylase II